MSDLVNTSVPATDHRLIVSALSEVISNSPETGRTIAEERNSSDMPNTSECTKQTSLTDVSRDENAACSSSCSNYTVADESVTVAGLAAEKMCIELEQSNERIVESEQLSPSADELRSSVSEVKSPVRPVGGLLRSTEECQSDTVTFNLPLEVIGACWFMKRDTDTCLQATTSNDEKIVIRLNKKDSRVTLTFQANSGRSLFTADSDKCYCHVDSLLEPPRRPTTSVAGPALVATDSDSGQQRDSIAATNSTPVPVSAIDGIAAHLRARNSVSVNYRDSDDEDTDVADNCENGGAGDYAENDVSYLDDGEDFDVSEDDEDEVNSVTKRNSFAVDDEWSPKKPRAKRTRLPVCLKFKLKTDPGLDDELNAIQNDSASCDVTDSCESKSLTDSKKGHKSSLVPKSLTKKLKHVSHKKSHLQTAAKNGVRSARSKDGPKFEKKGICPHCDVFYGNLGQHVSLYCPKNPNRQRAYHCCYCKFRSIDRATLLEHKATHVLARDFKCEICDSSFFTRQRLVRHMRYVHLLGTNPVRIYTCDRCGKRFRYHSHYDRHLTIHSEEKTAQCDQCGKFFKNSHNVRNHQSRMHPGKPEQFPFFCSECGQGTHSLTAHRCIRPGEMHGSRRRRAPRSATFSSPVTTSVSAAISEGVSVATPPPPALMRLSPLLKQDDQLGENFPTSVNMTSQAVDCSATVRSVSSESRPESRQPLDCNVASSRLVDQHSEMHSHVINHLPSPSSQSDVHYPSTPASQSFDRHAVPFDHLSIAMPLDRHGISRPSYHHSAQSLAASELPYDRRMAPSFQSQQPAVAHQPPQQPPYSNLFAVDPLLQQLRAANMMYRVDY